MSDFVTDEECYAFLESMLAQDMPLVEALDALAEAAFEAGNYRRGLTVTREALDLRRPADAVKGTF